MAELATRATFLGGLQRRYGELVLPVAGVAVRYQSLSEREMSVYELARWDRDEEGNLQASDEALRTARARLIVLCLVDGDGNRLLTDADLEQVMLLDAVDMGALYDVLRDHCGIDRRVSAAKKNGSPMSAEMNG